MEEQFLFTDGSVDMKSGTGFGAYLYLSDPEVPIEFLKKKVKVKRFESTSSTKLELQTLLWALRDISLSGKRITIYTDSQNITGLLKRRERLGKRNFSSKKGRRIKNEELYREFFRITYALNCEFKKVTGHQPSKQKDAIHRLFTLVDRASRSAMRKNTP